MTKVGSNKLFDAADLIDKAAYGYNFMATYEDGHTEEISAQEFLNMANKMKLEVLSKHFKPTSRPTVEYLKTYRVRLGVFDDKDGVGEYINDFIVEEIDTIEDPSNLVRWVGEEHVVTIMEKDYV